MSRIPAVVRMYLTDRVTMFALPPAILAASFAVNLAIFAVEPVQARSTGGLAAIFVVMLAAAVMSTARAMPFALSMGSSRRSFAIGTGVTGVIMAVVFGVLLLILNRIEAATDGWGLHGHFFTFPWTERYHVVGAWLLATVLLLAMFLLGAFASTIWLRWKQPGMLVAGVLLVLVFGGLVTLITWQHGWPSVGRWFLDLTPLAAAGWIALLCVPLAGGSFVTLRRVAL